MKYILAHDLGTSGNKAAIFDEEGSMLGSELFTYEVRYYNETWAEQDPEDWWRAICISSNKLIKLTKINVKDIAVVSFSGQMMGCLCLDEKGTPLRNAIIWADQRSVKQAADIEEKISQKQFYNITGHRISPSYGLEKLMWVQDNQPAIYKNTYKALNAKDYIVMKLTGMFATEPTDACGFACMDLMSNTWSSLILEASGVDENKLPEIKPSTHVAGYISKEAARETGLYPGTPVVLGGGDGICANVGAGSVRPGKTYCSLGSSSWVATTSNQPVLDEDMRTVCWAHIIPGYYSPNGTMQTGGGAYSWLKSNICRWEVELAEKQEISPYELINGQVEQSVPGANGVLFLPYLLGERSPWWNSAARATFLGIKMENTRSDLLRSVLEGVAMNLALIFNVFCKYEKIDELLLIGGGARGAIWAQIISDIFGVRTLIPKVLEEATSMGAAITGGVGVGLFKSFDIIEQMIQITASYRPNINNREIYSRALSFFKLSYRALEGVYGEMAKKEKSLCVD